MRIGYVVEASVQSTCFNKLELSLFFSSQCSVTCGSGIIRRAVKCLARNRTYLDDSYCTSPTSTKPETTRLCQMKACKWQKRLCLCVGPQFVHIQKFFHLVRLVVNYLMRVNKQSVSFWRFILEGPPTSCRDVQLTKGILTDGEQTLTVDGKELQVKLLKYQKLLIWQFFT